MVYRMKIAGLERDLPICKVAEDLYIGAFVIFWRSGAHGGRCGGAAEDCACL